MSTHSQTQPGQPGRFQPHPCKDRRAQPASRQQGQMARRLQTGHLKASPLACLLACVLAVASLLALLPAASVQAGGIVWPTSGAAANAAGRWPSLAEIPCGAYIVMNRNNGQVLLEKEADKAMYPASTTKVLTALIALERLDPNQILTLSPQAVALTANASRVGYKAGEKVYVRDLLAGMMLASGNDAANAVGEAVSGTTEAFAQVMNERARQTAPSIAISSTPLASMSTST